MSKNIHVTPHPDGGWQVKTEGNSRATARTNTQQEAINIARPMSQNREVELATTCKRNNGTSVQSQVER